jgi:hypothetical protein
MAAAEEKKNMLRLHVDDSQMEWVCEQHQKGKYLYTNELYVHLMQGCGLITTHGQNENM